MAVHGFSEKGIKRVINVTRTVERQAPLKHNKSVDGPRGKEPRRKACTLVSQDDDTITVTLPGGTSPTDDVVAAKPYLVRRTPFDGGGRNGFTYVYSSASARVSTKTSDASTEEQIVTPDYVTGDEVVIRRINGDDLIGDNLADVKYIDCNEDARCFMKS